MSSSFLAHNVITRGRSSFVGGLLNRSSGVKSRNIVTTTSFISKLRNTNNATRAICRMKSYYTPAHEYITKLDDDSSKGRVGITDFAQSALGDIVFVDLPEVGDDFEKGEAFGSVESVKAASDVYAPVSGTVTAINEKLVDDPGLVNTAAETDAWFIELDTSDNDDEHFDTLMDDKSYKEHCEAEQS